MSKNIRALSYRKELEENLFEEIVKVKEEGKGEKDLKETADKFLVGKSVVLGTSTFYDFLRDENLKKKVFLCNGTACMVSGKQEKLKEKLLKHFSEDEIGHVACVGRCHENSSVLYQNKTYTLENEEDVDRLIKEKEGDSSNNYIIGSNMNEPILISDMGAVQDWYSLLKNFIGKKDQIIQELQISNLRGRGGAGFPFFIKIKTSMEAKSDQKYVVCNADEGDPGAFSDMYLMEHQAHKVLFGMMATGFVTGADKGVLYIRAEYPDSVRIVQEAIDELKTLNLLGDHILGTDFSFDFKIIKGAGAYICGEEAALLNSIEGLRPEVRTRPPFPATEGLYGKPTVLSNVETFANIHWILEKGGIEFAKLGNGKSTGSKLVSLDGFFKNPGLYEVPMGTPVSEVIYDLAGGYKQKIKAMQIGGPLGGIVPAAKFNDLSVDFESFNEQGFLLGHASFVCIPENFPIIKFLAHLFEFTKDESCGKCFPCRIGSVRGYELLENAMKKNVKIDKTLFADLLETLELGSLCALGGGLPLPVLNALEYFEPELRTYFK